MLNINDSPYSRCVKPGCDKKYFSWGELQTCTCGSPTERYMISREEIIESNRRVEEFMEQERRDPKYQRFMEETRQALLGDVALCLYLRNRRN